VTLSHYDRVTVLILLPALTLCHVIADNMTL